MKNKKMKGFTLIELLIVIAIIGILASIVLVNLSTARNKANAAAFKSKVASMQAALIMACDGLTTNTVAALKSAVPVPTGSPTVTYPGGNCQAPGDAGALGETTSCGSSGAGTFRICAQTTIGSATCLAGINEKGASYSGDVCN